MSYHTILKFTLTVLSVSILLSCNRNPTDQFDSTKNEQEIKKTLSTLLSSIENKDIDALKSTMSPSGKMELIVSNTPITYSVDEFVNFHEGWFKDSSWTMETKILNIEAGLHIGTATTEAIYREPIRDGKPYMNHMIVSYVLEKDINKNWYVIKDHASTLSKTK